MASLRLGLCCMNTDLRKCKVYASHTCTLDTIDKKGAAYVYSLAAKNLLDLIPLILWNELHGIKVFRLSSKIFPHINNPRLPFKYDVAEFSEYLTYIGNLVKYLGHRLTFHPGQYNIIGAVKDDVYQNTVAELSTHAKIFDLMGLDKDSVMVIHGGGVYGDKEETMKRWARQYEQLPDYVKRRLVLENCEKSYSVEDCLRLSSMVGGDLPVVLDIHHYQCYSLLHPKVTQRSLEKLIPLVLATWSKRGIRPKFHISEQGSGKIGHHSDYISEIPDIFFQTAKTAAFDLMIEAKAKQGAVKKLYELYPELRTKSQPNPFVYQYKSQYPYLFQ